MLFKKKQPKIEATPAPSSSNNGGSTGLRTFTGVDISKSHNGTPDALLSNFKTASKFKMALPQGSAVTSGRGVMFAAQKGPLSVLNNHSPAGMSKSIVSITLILLQSVIVGAVKAGIDVFSKVVDSLGDATKQAMDGKGGMNMHNAFASTGGGSHSANAMSDQITQAEVFNLSDRLAKVEAKLASTDGYRDYKGSQNLTDHVQGLEQEMVRRTDRDRHVKTRALTGAWI